MNTNQALTVAGALAITWIVLRYALLQRRGTRPAAPGRASEATLTWLGSYSEAFQRSLDICGLLEIELVDADPNRGAILAKAGLPALGATSPVRITLRTQEGVTTVTMTAGAGLVDVGQSQRLTRRFVEIWDRMPEPIKREG